MERATGILYEFDLFRVDPENRRLTRKGQPVSLAPLMFNTLLFFVENSGRLITKSELLTVIWPDTVVDDPNLAVMISVVRKALGDSGNTQKYIETVAKAGYRFGADVQIMKRPEQPAAPLAEPPVLRVPATREMWRIPSNPAALLLSVAILLASGVLFVFGRQIVTSRVSPDLYSIRSGGRGNRSPRLTNVSIDAGPASLTSAEVWYFKGRYALSRGTKNGLNQSIVYFSNAIADDPRNALAYAGLADAYGSLATWSVQSSDLTYRKAKEAAQRAIELDDSLSQAHSALGTVAMVYDWDFALAGREFRRAVELGPSDPIAHHRLGGYLAATGKLEDALREVRIAHNLDPLSLDIGITVGRILYYSRRFDEAMAEYRKLIDLDPHYTVAHYNLSATYVVQRDFTRALPELEETVRLASNRDPLALGLYGAAKAESGDRTGAREIMAELRERSRREFVTPVGMAFLYLGLGDEEEALNWIEKIFEDHMTTSVWANLEPLFDPLRSNPRFLAQLKRINSRPSASLMQVLHLASR